MRQWLTLWRPFNGHKARWRATWKRRTRAFSRCGCAGFPWLSLIPAIRSISWWWVVVDMECMYVWMYVAMFGFGDECEYLHCIVGLTSSFEWLTHCMYVCRCWKMTWSCHPTTTNGPKPFCWSTSITVWGTCTALPCSVSIVSLASRKEASTNWRT